MTVMNEAEFLAFWAALNDHLKEVQPIFDDFCARNGFVCVNRKSLGRYPRIRIERVGGSKLWFDLWMELDKHGRRFEQFRRDLPYELAAGAYVDVECDSRHRTRFQKSILLFSGKPFDQVSAVLEGEMRKHLSTLEEWDAEYLKKNGQRVELRSQNKSAKQPFE